MAIKVLALASGVTGLTDHRILNGSLLTSDGQLAVRGGILPGLTSGNLSTVSAMVARVAPVKVVIPNSISAALGPYLLVSDANVDITFDAGEASVSRVDRIIARSYDNTNDGSGQTTGSIYYLKGQASGLATALPNNSVLLYEMTIPAGASAGGGGVNFSNAVDKRVYTTAQGGIIPVASATDMTAISNPYEGMGIYRTDLDVLYIHDGTNFKPRGQVSVASSGSLSNVTNPYDGLIATARDADAIWLYDGSTWRFIADKYTTQAPLVGLTNTTIQSVANNGAVLTWDNENAGAAATDPEGFHSTSSNTSRITPTIAGWYRFSGTIHWSANATGRRGTGVRYNGSTIFYGMIIPASSVGTTSTMVSISLFANGTTDYFELFGYQDSGGSLNTADTTSTNFQAAMFRH